MSKTDLTEADFSCDFCYSRGVLGWILNTYTKFHIFAITLLGGFLDWGLVCNAVYWFFAMNQSASFEGVVTKPSKLRVKMQYVLLPQVNAWLRICLQIAVIWSMSSLNYIADRGAMTTIHHLIVDMRLSRWCDAAEMQSMAASFRCPMHSGSFLFCNF